MLIVSKLLGNHNLQNNILLLFRTATLKGLVESPGPLSVYSSSQCMLLPREVANGHLHVHVRMQSITKFATYVCIWQLLHSTCTVRWQ